jgi:branched-chain amino acid transport system substrate-binding protein
MMFLVDALERAGSRDREKIIEALASSNWNGHFMPYGPTKMVNGQNQGARPVVTQIVDGQVRLVHPDEYANAKPQFLQIRY